MRKKHVFLVQVHKEPELVARILHRLEAPNHYFIVNIDKKVSKGEYAEFTAQLNDISNVILNKRFNVIHGGFSQINCTLAQVNLLYSQIPDFDYIHTISGQCYPCVTSAEFDEFFENNKKSYCFLDSAADRQQWLNSKYAKRVGHWYLNDVFDFPWARKILLDRIINKLVYFIPRRFVYFEDLWGGVELVFT